MPFPSTPDKHLDPSSYPPSRFLGALTEMGWEPGTVPRSVLLTYARFELWLATRPDLFTPNPMLGTGPGRFFLVNASDGRVGINCLGIGAPAVVAQMELQAELGVTRFLSIGTAGGFDPSLSPGDVVVVDRAVRDEGTSYHYLPPEAEARPDPTFTDALAAALTGAGIEHRTGATLTTDAPHRTVARDIERMRADGVLAVEMEASAVFAFGLARGITTASALVIDGVADEGDEWHLGLLAANAALQRVFASSVELLVAEA